MSYLFDYGEGFLCLLPVFFIMASIGAALLWNSLPSRTVEKKTNDNEPPERH